MARRGSPQHAGVMNTTSANPEAEADPHSQSEHHEQPPPQPQPSLDDRQLYRPVQDRMLTGVAAGIARYLGVDVTIVRIVIAVLAVAGGAGVPLYVAGWLLIPEEGREQSIAGEFIQSRQPRSL
jgi:phage shock protein PspC (stress-responsive transcriptional regulator)